MDHGSWQLFLIAKGGPDSRLPTRKPVRMWPLVCPQIKEQQTVIRDTLSSEPTLLSFEKKNKYPPLFDAFLRWVERTEAKRMIKSRPVKDRSIE